MATIGGKDAVQASIFLERSLHAEARIAAFRAGLSLTRWVETIIRKELGVNPNPSPRSRVGRKRPKQN